MGGNPLSELGPEVDLNEHAPLYTSEVELEAPPVSDEAQVIATDQPVPTEERRQFILVIKPVDKFNTIASRELVTPATCLECGFDVIRKNELQAWDELTQDTQTEVLGALQAHKDAMHAGASAQIVYEDEIPTEWLGNN